MNDLYRYGRDGLLEIFSRVERHSAGWIVASFGVHRGVDDGHAADGIPMMDDSGNRWFW